MPVKFLPLFVNDTFCRILSSPTVRTVGLDNILQNVSLTNNGRNLTGIFYSTNNRSIEDIFTILK